MSFKFDGDYATDVRPPHIPAPDAGGMWARDAGVAGVNRGTRLTASVINQIVDNLRRICDANDVALAEGEGRLLQAAVLSAVGTAGLDGSFGIRRLLSLFPGWPRSEGGAVPEDPDPYHVHTVTVPVVHSDGTVTAAGEIMYNPDVPWIDGSPVYAPPSKELIARAIAHFAGIVADRLIFKGTWDASSGTFPSIVGIKTGWFWRVSVGGTVGGVLFSAGDDIYAVIDNPNPAVFAANWSKIEGGISGAEVNAALGYTAADAAALAAKQDVLPHIGFYTNVGPGASVLKAPDRLMVGAAADADAAFPIAGLPAWVAADWSIRDAQLGVVHRKGLIAAAFASRSADYTDGLQQSTIAASGYVVNDRANATARAFYAEVQHEAAASAGAGYGHEIVIKDKSGVNSIKTPYGGSGFGTMGAYFNAGGDISYGGAATNNSGTVAWVTGNGTWKWNKGIIFDRLSLDGADGTAGGGATAVAMEMAYGQGIRWYSANGSKVAGAIRSLGTSSADKWHEIQFLNDEIAFTNAGATPTFDILHVASGVNYLQASDAVTGAAALLSAKGSDTDIDLLLSPKGAGILRTGAKFSALQLLMSGAVSAAAWTTAGIGLRIDAATYTDTSSAGTVGSVYVHNIAAPTLAAAAAVTFSNAYTLDIAGPPVAGANVTITTAGALRVGSGVSQFNGLISGGAGLTIGGGNANINASNNFTTNINTGTSTSDVTLGGGSNKVVLGSALRKKVWTVAALPSAATVGNGCEAYVSDSTLAYSSANIGSTLTGGGANLVPVYSDGTVWRIG